MNVVGGGHTGQAGAIVLGLSRALKDYDSSLESALRKDGYLEGADAANMKRLLAKG